MVIRFFVCFVFDEPYTKYIHKKQFFIRLALFKVRYLLCRDEFELEFSGSSEPEL